MRSPLRVGGANRRGLSTSIAHGTVFLIRGVMRYNTELTFYSTGGNLMTFTLTQVRLLVTAFEACYFFYRDTLGFSVGYGSEKEDYASFKTDNAVVAIYKRPLMAEVAGTDDLPATVESQDRVLLHFQVDNVDETVAQLRAKGMTIVAEPTDRPTWGSRTAHFRDPDGTLIEISQGLG